MDIGRRSDLPQRLQRDHPSTFSPITIRNCKVYSKCKATRHLTFVTLPVKINRKTETKEK